MSFLKKTKLSIALSTALVGGMLAGNAQAVNLTPDGLGDAALFSYFSAKSSWQTFIRLINTSDNAVAVKVRFREAANSREILDFVVILSPHDMWVGWTDGAATASGKPGVRTADTSCIFEGVGATSNLDEGFQTLHGSVKAAAFKDRAFVGQYADDYNVDAANKKTADARMREGHIEVIGIAEFDSTTEVYQNSLHNNGQPNSCGGARAALLQAAKGGFTANTTDVGNVIAANAYMINVSAGQGGGYDPTMLANFYTPGIAGGASPLKGIAESDLKPNLDSGTPVSSLMSAEQMFIAGWDIDAPTTQDGNTNPALHRHANTKGGIESVTGSADAVSSLLMRTNVINEWAAKGGGKIVKDYYTQWVLTFPTKNYYVDIDQDKIKMDHAYPTLACVKGSLQAAKAELAAALAAAAAAENAYNSVMIPQVGENAADLYEKLTDAVTAAKALNPGDDWDAYKAILKEVDAVGDAQFADAVALSTGAGDFVLKAVAFVKAGLAVNLHKKEYSCETSPGVINPDGFAPFTNRFQAKGMSCESYNVNIYNREESQASFTSPRPGANPGLCYETNVVSFGAKYAKQGLASEFASVVPDIFLPTDNSTALKSVFGWANLKFTGVNATQKGLVSFNGLALSASDLTGGTAGLTAKLVASQVGATPNNLFGSHLTLKGLPVDGFLFSVYTTGAASNNHTTINAHKYERDISDNIVLPQGG